MRILYLHQYFATPDQPDGTRSYEISKRLVEQGHSVDLIASDITGQSRGWREETIDGIRVHRCSVAYSNHMTHWQRIKAFFQFAYESRRRAMSIACDVVYATSTPLTIAIPGVAAAKHHNVPMVFEVRDLWPEVPIAMGAIRFPPLVYAARKLAEYAYSNAAHVVALSPDMKQGICRAGVPESKVTVIPNASNLKAFHVSESVGHRFREQHDWLGARPLVVYAGTFGRINGVDYLVRLAHRIQNIAPEIRFLLVGDGCEVESVRRLASELGVLGKSLFILPPVKKCHLPEILSAADFASSVVIDKSELWANSANKAFDAFAASRPLMINHQGWLADVIERRECGLVLSPTDLDLAAESLVKAISSEEWLATAKHNAGCVGRTEFEQDRLFANVEDVLRFVTSTPRIERVAA